MRGNNHVFGLKNIQQNLDGIVTMTFWRRNGDTSQPLLGIIDQLKKEIVDFSEGRDGQIFFYF